METNTNPFGGAIARAYPDVLPATDAMLAVRLTFGHGTIAVCYAAASTPARWIRKCKCGLIVRFEGRDGFIGSTSGAIRSGAVAADGRIAVGRVINTHEAMIVACTCGRNVVCARVRDGGKPDSKRHECGARCRNAVGPSCDCKCRGEHHGCG